MDLHPLAAELMSEEVEPKPRPTVAEQNARYRKGGDRFEESMRDHDDLGDIPLAPKFHGAKPPTLAVMTEKPIHRLMAFWVASGRSNIELAELTGYARPYVSQLIRQPWFQQQVSHIIAQAGEDELMTRIRGAGVDSVMKLIELRDSSESDSVKLGATKELLDRLLGKPQQNVNQTITRKDPKDELDSVERELDSLRKQEKTLLEG